MTVERHREVQGVRVPTFLYGTAWKEERTAELVREALRAGFLGVDTANQRRHYHEVQVGKALREAEAAGEARAQDLFIQTKFTHRAGQDHRLPYDPEAPVSRQVVQSFRSSLEHLGVEVLDSYVLHGPTRPRTLGDEDLQAWRAMEEVHGQGGCRLLGVSNFSAGQLEELLAMARVAPAFVQNRCFARAGWDAPVRRLCSGRGIVYQGFSLLTANPQVLTHPEVQEIARSRGRTVPQLIFRFALEVDMVPLTGTTDPDHMREDLEVYDFSLDDRERGILFRAGM